MFLIAGRLPQGCPLPFADIRPIAQAPSIWPFSRRKADPIDAMLDEAILFARDRWLEFQAGTDLAANIHLRDRIGVRIGVFSKPFRATLYETFPDLKAAPDEMLLLIIVKRIEASGKFSARQIETQLGITVPR